MKPSTFPILLLFSLLLSLPVRASLTEATLTRAVNQVETITPAQGARPAKVGQTIQGQTEVQTGPKSLAELTFPDQTLARIGSTSRFGFEAGTRQIDLENGTLLLQVPKNLGGATIRTAAVTAAITGTTTLIESSPRNKTAAAKVIVLEGKVRVNLPGAKGKGRTLRAGEMIVIPEGASKLPPPMTVDLRRLVRSSRLINAGGGLPDMEEIDLAINRQQQRVDRGSLSENPAQPNPDNAAMNNAQQMGNIQSRTDAAPQNQPAPPRPQPQPKPPTPPAPTPVPTPPPGPSPTPHYPY